MMETTRTHHGHRPPLFIGLCGLAGVGKDTVAKLLAMHCGAARIAFADALRAEICAAYRLDPIYLTRRETKEHPITALALSHCLDGRFVQRMRSHFASGLRPGGLVGEEINLDAPRSPRQIMQWWGTEYRRAQCPWYWVGRAHDACRQAMAQGATTIVLTDVRAANEAALLRAYSGSLWQIKRPGYTAAGQPGHSSEVDGSAWAPDAVINNAHEMRHLQHLVLSTYASLLCNTATTRASRVAAESEAA